MFHESNQCRPYADAKNDLEVASDLACGEPPGAWAAATGTTHPQPSPAPAWLTSLCDDCWTFNPAVRI